MAELLEAGGLAYSDVTFMNDATEALLEVSCGAGCRGGMQRARPAALSGRQRRSPTHGACARHPAASPPPPPRRCAQCRRVLKYTYVYGFYLPEGREKALFEDLQSRLEKSTEHVAELTEQPVDKINRADVVNFTRVTLNFLKNLLEGLDMGLIGDEAGAAPG